MFSIEVSAPGTKLLLNNAAPSHLQECRPRSESIQEMTNSKVQRFKWDDMPKEKLNDLIDRRIITGEKVMLTHVYLKKGAMVPMHSHFNEQITYILEGKLKFWIESEDADPITVGPGDVLVLPSNLSHKAEALEDTLDVDIFAPPREDWLKKEDDYLRG